MPDANERFFLGLIGCGGRGQDLMEHFAEHGAAFSVVCDPDESRMQLARAAAKGNTEMAQDFRQLLESKKVDAVVHWALGRTHRSLWAPVAASTC
jgi:predicted dehydrogenase